MLLNLINKLSIGDPVSLQCLYIKIVILLSLTNYDRKL